MRDTATREAAPTHLTATARQDPQQSEPVETNDRPTEAFAGSNDWRLNLPTIEGGIEAYTTRVSGPEGTRVGLKVSTAAHTWRVLVFRIGNYRGGSGHLVWQSSPQRGGPQPEAVLAPTATRTVVAPWRRSLVIDTDGWLEGYYVLKLRTASGAETQVPYIVSSRSAEGTVALVAPVTTWQAYNDWGGYSLYDGPGGARSWAVASTGPYHAKLGANDYRTAALPIVIRAERLGVPLSYFANVDLHARPHLLDGARGYVSMGHDEYWTTQMRMPSCGPGTTAPTWRSSVRTRCTGGSGSPPARRDRTARSPATEATPTSTRCARRDPTRRRRASATRPPPAPRTT